ncbi:HNH endonuclease [Murinocardiopsis flavida]|uniref:HNH endonuclease n=1 Tax=Murinocardiopsis flavida TaxID=645275 RepID=A0A2P8DIU9_9ACTN|nr:HNH endonuclease signature motif containing protein [Murinocardiopsis flavida]PSK97156.1 HNH endonuclease [Murinocardiopsis flavida]
MIETQAAPSQPGRVAQARKLLGGAARLLRDESAEAIPPGAAREVAEELTSLLADLGRVQAAVAQVAARAKASGGMASAGFRRAADWFSCAGGLTRSEGAQYAALADFPEGLDASWAAMEDGGITAAKAARIAHHVGRCAPLRDRELYPSEADLAGAVEQILLPLALKDSSTCKDLDRAGARLFATLHPADHDRSEAELHEGRSAGLAHDPVLGGFHFGMSGDSADYDALRTALDAFSAPPAEGDQRTAAQRRYDSAMAMVRFCLAHSGNLPWRGGEPAQVRLTVPLATLRGEPGSPPATSDNGVVYSVSQARALAKDCKLRRIILDPITGAPLDVGRSERICPPHIRNAIHATYDSCAWEHGCDRPIAWCQIDHITAWWDGGSTSLSNLQPLCAAHNLAKERRRAAAERRRHRHPVRDGHGTDPPPGCPA